MIFRYLRKKDEGTLGAPDETGNHVVIGYLMLADTTDASVPDLASGCILDNKTEAPPWHIVDHDLRTMTVPNWPIGLWKVQALKPISPQRHKGNYTRCSAIKVLESLPSFMVFGETDTGIVDIIEFAQKMTLEQAQSLSKLRGKDAPAMSFKIWQRWIKQNGISKNGSTQDFDDVLSIGRSHGDSPIRSGLLLISRVIFDQAGKVDAERAYSYQEDGTPFLAAPWNGACSTLKDAALSFGASEFHDKTDMAEMRRPLQQVAPDLVKTIQDKMKK